MHCRQMLSSTCAPQCILLRFRCSETISPPSSVDCASTKNRDDPRTRMVFITSLRQFLGACSNFHGKVVITLRSRLYLHGRETTYIHNSVRTRYSIGIRSFRKDGTQQDIERNDYRKDTRQTGNLDRLVFMLSCCRRPTNACTRTM